MSKGREGSDHRPNSQLPDDGNPEVMPPGLVPRNAPAVTDQFAGEADKAGPICQR